MSAELYDAEHEGAFSRPAIDILPTPGGRKAKPAPTEEPAQAPDPVSAEWAAPLAQGPNTANPWGEQSAPLPTTAAPLAPLTELPPLDDFIGEPTTDAGPKKFLGVARRRAKKATEPGTAPTPETAAAPGADAADAYPAAAPLAAWPTDVAMPVVAHAEPPAAFAATQTPTADFAPVEAAESIQPEPVVDLSAAHANEVQAWRTMAEASEAGRVEAENRAALAVAYAQAAQAQLSEAASKAQAQIQAAEARARSAANDAQDWQIRHREADATIGELAVSVASAERRLAELRTERDELLNSLEAATRPDHETSAT